MCFCIDIQVYRIMTEMWWERCQTSSPHEHFSSLRKGVRPKGEIGSLKMTAPDTSSRRPLHTSTMKTHLQIWTHVLNTTAVPTHPYSIAAFPTHHYSNAAASTHHYIITAVPTHCYCIIGAHTPYLYYCSPHTPLLYYCCPHTPLLYYCSLYTPLL